MFKGQQKGQCGSSVAEGVSSKRRGLKDFCRLVKSEMELLEVIQLPLQKDYTGCCMEDRLRTGEKGSRETSEEAISSPDGVMVFELGGGSAMMRCGWILGNF